MSEESLVALIANLRGAAKIEDIMARQEMERVGFRATEAYSTNGALLREAADALDAAEKERDDAVTFMANEEFVLRGYPSGDRTVVLANIRALPPQSQSAEER